MTIRGIARGAWFSDAPPVDYRHWPDLPRPAAQASSQQGAGQPPASWAFHPPTGHRNGSVPEPAAAGDDLPSAAAGAPGAEPDHWAGHYAHSPEPWESSRYDIPDGPVAKPPAHRHAEPGGPRHGWVPPTQPASGQARGAAPEPEPAEPEAEPPPGWLPVLAGTAGAFVVPVLIYLLWSLSLSGEAPAGCVDAVGAACRSPRGDALANLRGVLPSLTAALALALVTATGLRWISRWRSPTIAFAAAVIGAGLVTLIASAFG